MTDITTPQNDPDTSKKQNHKLIIIVVGALLGLVVLIALNMK